MRRGLLKRVPYARTARIVPLRSGCEGGGDTRRGASGWRNVNAGEEVSEDAEGGACAVDSEAGWVTGEGESDFGFGVRIGFVRAFDVPFLGLDDLHFLL